jgi:hypothetical protein
MRILKNLLPPFFAQTLSQIGVNAAFNPVPNPVLNLLRYVKMPDHKSMRMPLLNVTFFPSGVLLRSDG